jgi:hypothetical protein
MVIDHLINSYACREGLERAVKIYTDRIGKKAALLVEAYCGLAHLCLKMGDWASGKDHLGKAEDLLNEGRKEEEIMVRSIILVYMFVRSLFSSGLLSV